MPSSSELSEIEPDLNTDEELEQLAQPDEEYYDEEDSDANEQEEDEETPPVTATTRQGRVTIKYKPKRERKRIVDDEEEEEFVKMGNMTERQRSRLVDSNSQTPEPFVELEEGSKRRVLTEQESQLRKQENARKRKNHNERKLEEEKQDTLNKLLKKRAGKVASTERDQEDATTRTGDKPRRPMLHHPALFTWRSTASETVLRVPF